MVSVKKGKQTTEKMFSLARFLRIFLPHVHFIQQRKFRLAKTYINTHTSTAIVILPFQMIQAALALQVSSFAKDLRSGYKSSTGHAIIPPRALPPEPDFGQFKDVSSLCLRSWVVWKFQQHLVNFLEHI